MPGEIISERRARSHRNVGRHHRGFAGDFPRTPYICLSRGCLPKLMDLASCEKGDEFGLIHLARGHRKGAIGASGAREVRYQLSYPDPNSICGRQPSAVDWEISRSLRGVPSGFARSTTSAITWVSFAMAASLPAPMLLARLGTMSSSERLLRRSGRRHQKLAAWASVPETSTRPRPSWTAAQFLVSRSGLPLGPWRFVGITDRESQPCCRRYA